MRAGRKRKQGARDKSGKLLRPSEDVRATVAQSRARRFGIEYKDGDDKDLLRPEYASTIGILYVNKDITSQEYEAALKFESIYSSFTRVCGIPSGSPQGVLGKLASGPGKGVAPEPDSEVVEALKREYGKIETALGKTAKSLLITAIMTPEEGLGFIMKNLIVLKKGLRNLAITLRGD